LEPVFSEEGADPPMEKHHLLSQLPRMGRVDISTRGVAGGKIRLQLPALSAQEGSFMPWDIPKYFDHYTRSIIESAGDIHHPGTRPWQAHPAGEILTGIHASREGSLPRWGQAGGAGVKGGSSCRWDPNRHPRRPVRWIPAANTLASDSRRFESTPRPPPSWKNWEVGKSRFFIW